MSRIAYAASASGSPARAPTSWPTTLSPWLSGAADDVEADAVLGLRPNVG